MWKLGELRKGDVFYFVGVPAQLCFILEQGIAFQMMDSGTNINIGSDPLFSNGAYVVFIRNQK
jgi:hypothetical protein